NWAASASWNTTGAISGVYFAKIKRPDTGRSNHVIFVVREDDRQADVVVQTSDTTWQAYNLFGGASLYCAPNDGSRGLSNAGTEYNGSCSYRGTKVSYNRPFNTRNLNARSFLFYGEFPLIKFLEGNGYNVKYISGVDTDRGGAALAAAATKPQVFLSVGHD